MIKIYINIDNRVPTFLGILLSKIYQNNQNLSTQIIIKKRFFESAVNGTLNIIHY